MLAATKPVADVTVCRTCGACCAYSRDWPRFTTESDSQIARIATKYIADDLSGVRCRGDRCSALMGAVGTSTSCGIYEVRPDVCRACEPGDEACAMARQKFGLSPLMPVPAEN
jgi:uncharacterized protein